MATITTCLPGGGTSTRVVGPPESPDDLPNEDGLVLRRVLIRFMLDSGQTLPQIAARFAAAKRQTD